MKWAIAFAALVAVQISGVVMAAEPKLDKQERESFTNQQSRPTQINNKIGGVVLDKGEVSFEKDGVSIRLTWVVSKEMGRYGPSTSKISYNVFRNNNSIYPSSKGGGKFEGCGINNVSWKSLGKPQIGWMLVFKGICGNTNSYNVLVVVPNEDNYVSQQFSSKETPSVKYTRGGNICIWSSYQEWGQTGTAGSFFVPELRMVIQNILMFREIYRAQEQGKTGVAESFPVPEPGTVIPAFLKDREIYHAPLPGNVMEWPKALPYRSFLGDFYAGLRDLDADVMRSALKAYDKINYDWLKDQGLPDSEKGLKELTDKIASVHKLKPSLNGIGLAWAHYFQKHFPNFQMSCLEE